MGMEKEEILPMNKGAHDYNFDLNEMRVFKKQKLINSP
jgi:hypothetical protein